MAARMVHTQASQSAEVDDFMDEVTAMLKRLQKTPDSFLGNLQDRQIGRLASICTRVDVKDEDPIYREGDDSQFLGIVLKGKLELLLHGHKLLELQVGDVLGEIELCNPQGGSSARQHSLVACGTGTIARIMYQDFILFVESLGPRYAKVLARHLADYVLSKVVKEEEEAEQEDRQRLENVGRTRRGCVSDACTMDLMSSVGEVSSQHLLRTASRTSSDGGSDWSVPFYFEEGVLKPAMKETIQAVMLRLPILSQMDSELKKLFVNSFLVATKKPGQFIVHKDQKMEYFFIIFKGECGEYSQIPWPAQFDAACSVENQVVGGAYASPGANFDRMRTPSSQVSGESTSGHVRRSPSKAVATGQGFRRAPSNTSVSSHQSGRGGLVGQRKLGRLQRPSVPPSPGSVQLQDSNDGLMRLPSSSSTIGQVAGVMGKLENVHKKVMARSASFSKKDARHYELLKKLPQGEFFGDLSLILDAPSDTHVKAISEATLLMLPAKAFRDLRHAHEKQVHESRMRLLQGAPFGHFLSTQDVSRLADALFTQRFSAGDNVIHADSSDCFILQSGVAVETKQGIGSKGSRGGSPVAVSRARGSPAAVSREKSKHLGEGLERREGSTFCLWNLSTTLVELNPCVDAVTDCVFLVLHRKSFIDLIGSYDALIAGKDAAAEFDKPEIDKKRLKPPGNGSRQVERMAKHEKAKTAKKDDHGNGESEKLGSGPESTPQEYAEVHTAPSTGLVGQRDRPGVTLNEAADNSPQPASQQRSEVSQQQPGTGSNVPALQSTVNAIGAALTFGQLGPEDGYNAFDADENGKVSLADLKNAVERLQLDVSNNNIEMSLAHFGKAEAGYISCEEWKQAVADASIDEVLKSRGPCVPGDAVAAGATNSQDLSSMIRALLEYNKLSPRGGYESFDYDADGKISLTDLQTAAKEYLARAEAEDVVRWHGAHARDGFVELDEWVRTVEASDGTEILRSRGISLDSERSLPGSQTAQTSVAALIFKALQCMKISLPEGFVEFDADGDGFISTQDLMQTVSDLKLTDNLSSSQILHWHAAANVSQSGRLNSQEWMTALQGADASNFKFVNSGLHNGSSRATPTAAAPELGATADATWSMPHAPSYPPSLNHTPQAFESAVNLGHGEDMAHPASSKEFKRRKNIQFDPLNAQMTQEDSAFEGSATESGTLASAARSTGKQNADCQIILVQSTLQRIQEQNEYPPAQKGAHVRDGNQDIACNSPGHQLTMTRAEVRGVFEMLDVNSGRGQSEKESIEIEDCAMRCLREASGYKMHARWERNAARGQGSPQMSAHIEVLVKSALSGTLFCADGHISMIEFIKGLRKSPDLANRLQLPSRIHQEQESRNIFQYAFGSMDQDQSKSISIDEFVAYFCGRDRAASGSGAKAAPEDDSWITAADANEMIVEMVNTMIKEASAQVQALAGELAPIAVEIIASEHPGDGVGRGLQELQGRRALQNAIAGAIEGPAWESDAHAKHLEERFYADEEAEVLQLSPVIETPPELGADFQSANAVTVRAQLQDAADRLDEHANEGCHSSKGLQISRPTTGASDQAHHSLLRQAGASGTSRPSTGMASMTSHHSGEQLRVSRPTTGSGSVRRSRPATSKAKDMQYSRPNTSGGPVQLSRPGTSGSGFAFAPGSHAMTNRLGTPDGFGPRSRSAASGMMGLDISRPGTQGSIPRTPGGNVMFKTQGLQEDPLFKTPSGTPSQSRAGSRQQSRPESKSSGGSRWQPGDTLPKLGERRSRASTSHLLSSEDEFLIPNQHDPSLEDLYASDDEDDEANQMIESHGMISRYTDTFFAHSEGILPSPTLDGLVHGVGAHDALSRRVKPGTPNPHAVFAPTSSKTLSPLIPALAEFTFGCYEDTDVHLGNIRLLDGSPWAEMCGKLKRLVGQEAVFHFPDPECPDGIVNVTSAAQWTACLDIFRRKRAELQNNTLEIDIVRKVPTRASPAEKRLSPAVVGRGVWGLDMSAQHPFLEPLERAAAGVPGPGEYVLPTVGKVGGRISDGQTPTKVDLLMRDAASKPGPLDYTPTDSPPLRGVRINPPSHHQPPSGSHETVLSAATTKDPRIGPGTYEIKSCIGKRPTARMSTAPKVSDITDIARQRSFTPGPGHYKILRDESDTSLAAKRRLAQLKTISDQHRRRAVTASAHRAYSRGASEDSFTSKPKTPMSVSLLLETVGGSVKARSRLPDPSSLCGEVRVGATCRAYHEQGIELA